MKIKPLNDWAVIIRLKQPTGPQEDFSFPKRQKRSRPKGPSRHRSRRFRGGEAGSEKKGEKRAQIHCYLGQAGERVMYDRYAGQKITIAAWRRVLVREVNILGILPPAPARPKEDLPPLMLPAMTTTGSSTALVSRKTTECWPGRKPEAGREAGCQEKRKKDCQEGGEEGREEKQPRKRSQRNSGKKNDD